MMKRLVYSLAILSILLFACNISTPVTPPVVIPASVVSETPTVTEILPMTETPTVTETSTAAETPTVTETPVPQTNINCYELSLFLEPALASGFSCQAVPETGGPNNPGLEVNPEYTELSLSGYVLSGRFFTPKISVYPVQRFSELLPDALPPKVAALQALIGGGPTGDKGLPFLPNFNAGQEFFAQYKVTSFGSGNGIRYLTQYSQYFDPINNHEMFYTFQGLTSNGKYWISAILPISNPILPADGNNPPNGQSWDDFGNNYPKYIADLTTQLNSQVSENYSPAITMLDALVASIRIKP